MSQVTSSVQRGMNLFTPPTEAEFELLLKSDKGWRKTASYNEIVYLYNIRSMPDIQIKVYTGLNSNGHRRGKGRDAIRICVISQLTNRGLLKFPHIKRTLGWQRRVRDRVIEAIRHCQIGYAQGKF